MQQKWYNATEVEAGSLNAGTIFYMETVEVSRLSALAFLRLGKNLLKGSAIFGKIEKKH